MERMLVAPAHENPEEVDDENLPMATNVTLLNAYMREHAGGFAAGSAAAAGSAGGGSAAGGSAAGSSGETKEKTKEESGSSHAVVPSLDEVSLWSLLAIIKLAEEENDCTEVVDAMREGASSAVVAKEGCDALNNLAVDVDNRKSIAEAGGIEMILRMMEVYGTSNAEVAENGCGALRNLAYNDDNKKSIGEIGGIAIILSMMEVHGASNAEVAYYGSAALKNLATNADNKRKICFLLTWTNWTSNAGVRAMFILLAHEINKIDSPVLL